MAVTTVWANEAHYEPLHLMPYTPAVRLAEGRQDRAFRTKTQIALSLVEQAPSRRHPVQGDRFGQLLWRQPGPASSVCQVSLALCAGAPGHTERWWAAELTLFGYGAGCPVRAVCATTDWRALHALSTRYLTTNLPAPSAPLKEIVRLYGLRNWARQSYKHMKDELGWADFMVRRDRAIRRHWTLVFCAFTFCGWQAALQAPSSQVSAPPEVPKKNQLQKNRQPQSAVLLAAPAARRALMADPGPRASALLGRLYRYAPAG